MIPIRLNFTDDLPEVQWTSQMLYCPFINETIF